MRVLATFEVRLDRTPDKRVWAVEWSGYSFLTRYLDTFEEVGIVARVRDVPHPPENGHVVTGDRVSVIPVPYYLGPVQYALRVLSVRRAIRRAIGPTDAIIVRVPGNIAACMVGQLPRSRPFGLMAVGDPNEAFGPGGVRTALRPLLRRWITARMRRECARACAVAYVTREALQRRYPASPAAFTTHYSNIDLADDAIAAVPRVFTPEQPPRRLIFVGTLQRMYKAPDVLLEAFAANVRRGVDLDLTFVGDGQWRPMLEQVAQRLGVAARVRFTGALGAGAPVRAELDRADLFVMTSVTEGLPRAMIEAMARGLPCIGTRVGGIPELLAPEDLVAPRDVPGLAAKIRDVVSDPTRCTAMSARNLARAREYHVDHLRARRKQFYECVRRATEDWLRAHKPLLAVLGVVIGQLAELALGVAT